MHPEPLEPRQLLSVSFDGRVLRIGGTEQADEIEWIVEATPSGHSVPLTINGNFLNLYDILPADPHSPTVVLPSRVVIKGRGSADRIEVELHNYVPRLKILGQGGADHIISHDTKAVIHGGAGDDLLEVPFRTRGDTLFGGAGDDLLRFGPGPDIGSAHGGPGNDTLIGSVGHDTLRGGPGNDLISGFAGDDVLLGADGDDTLRGGKGHDQLFGGPGGNVLVQDPESATSRP